MQVHFQFLSQALQKVQPVAQSCLAEALAQAQERCANSRSQRSDLGPLTELEEASRSWKGAAQVCSYNSRAFPSLRHGKTGPVCGIWKNQLVKHSCEMLAEWFPATVSFFLFARWVAHLWTCVPMTAPLQLQPMWRTLLILRLIGLRLSFECYCILKSEKE